MLISYIDILLEVAVSREKKVLCGVSFKDGGIGRWLMLKFTRLSKSAIMIGKKSGHILIMFIIWIFSI